MLFLVVPSPPCRHCPHQSVILVPTQLNPLRPMVGLAIAPSTKWMYIADFKQFNKFCTLIKVKPTLPIPPKRLQLFAAYLADSVSHKTIKVYIAGLRLGHILRGLPDPTQNPVLAYTVDFISLRTLRKRERGPCPMQIY